MGLLIYPVFDPPGIRLPVKTTGEFLAANFPALDTAAERLRLTPLTAFADYRPIPDGFDGSPDDLKEAMGPCTDWFDASKGEQTIAALADAVSSDPEEFEAIDCLEAVEEELRDLSQVLAHAARKGLRFRLEMS